MGRTITYHDLKFEKVPIEARTSKGSPFLRWVDTGMPQVPYQLLNCAFYLYRSKEDADNGDGAGGTGFFISIPTDDGLGHHYGVTNWHVAVRDGFSVVRINNTDGKPETFDLAPHDWIFTAGGNDIAVAPLSVRNPGQIATFIGSQTFLTPDIAVNERIAPGDDVFMVGRFVDLDVARYANVPAVRFGNISTLPVPIKQPTGFKEGLSYCIDMHSRSGYSGSPVFAFRTPGDSLDWTISGKPFEFKDPIMVLLGIHWGQFPEIWPLVNHQEIEEASQIELVPEGQSVKGVSGMTCVIPAWEITNLLNCDALIEQRKKVEDMRKKESPSRNLEPTAESQADTSKGDDILRNMLNTPPQPFTPSAASDDKKKKVSK